MNKAKNSCTSVVVLILATFSFGALAQNPVVVIPMAGDEYSLEYIWVPAADAEVSLGDAGLAHSASAAGGTNCIRQDVSGITQIDVNLPLHFSMPRNRNLALQGAQIYYSTEASGAYIDITRIEGRNFRTGEFLSLATDTVDRTSSPFSSYMVAVTENSSITHSSAPTNIRWTLGMTGLNSYVCLFGIRLKLG